VDLPGCRWLVDVIDETWIYPYVRDLFKEHWEHIPQIKGKYTYISRNPRECHARRCLNEDKMVLPLKKLGFSTYTMEHLTFIEQIRLFRSSECITGVHGAGFAWILFCHPGTIVFEVGRPEFYTKQHHYTQIAGMLNLKHYALVEEESKPSRIEYPTQTPDDIVLPDKKYMDCLKHILQNDR
jgi:capsular polysaccharide biosynthesis protein